MAHIISCVADADEPFTFEPYIAKAASPEPRNESITPPPGTCPDKQPFAWRMYQPEGRKYQLFPKGAPAAAAKGLDPEQAFAHAISQSQPSKPEKSDKLSAATNGLRLRIKEHNLNRRRKISVPELGPMTTVQEAAMDSPTIPGRPPLHERSISAPGSSWKQHHMDTHFLYSPIDEVMRPSATPDADAERLASPPPKQPLSPRHLAPLVIPTHQGHLAKLSKQVSLSRLRSGSTPAETTQVWSARTDDSSRTRTPLSAATTATTNMTASTLPTPISAPLADPRASPMPWEPRPGTTTPTQNLERSATPRFDPPRSASAHGHRRGASESGSIMDRGRPKKRVDHRANHSITSFTPELKAPEPKRSLSAERRAFEELPTGWRASEVQNGLSAAEIGELQKQAFGQASRFEVLRKEDVEALSRELRHLDERTEYLRRTYTSLRAGRRNLHSRICHYLRSPRVAKFSHDSMLKQEEALAELDTSIDDWVTKLERAENRRTRVRQKLLEHVAAAATLPAPGPAAASESLQQAMGVRPQQQHSGVGNISTPPRSPTKACPAPQSGGGSSSPHRVVAQVPSTILEQPLVEEAAADDGRRTMASLPGRDVQSIRVYADSDVYALLADVESEFTKMTAPVLEGEESQELHRARSHDLLCGTARPDSPTTPESDRAPSPPSKDAAPEPKEEEPIFLTAAVFRPDPPQRSLTIS